MITFKSPEDISKLPENHPAHNFDDEAALESLIGKVDRVTYEFESVPAETVEFLNG